MLWLCVDKRAIHRIDYYYRMVIMPNNTQIDIDRLMWTIETILKKYIQTVIGYKTCVSCCTVAILSVFTFTQFDRAIALMGYTNGLLCPLFDTYCFQNFVWLQYQTRVKCLTVNITMPYPNQSIDAWTAMYLHVGSTYINDIYNATLALWASTPVADTIAFGNIIFVYCRLDIQFDYIETCFGAWCRLRKVRI